jgi:hypothetical protein
MAKEKKIKEPIKVRQKPLQNGNHTAILLEGFTFLYCKVRITLSQNMGHARKTFKNHISDVQ